MKTVTITYTSDELAEILLNAAPVESGSYIADIHCVPTEDGDFTVELRLRKKDDK